MSILRRYSGTSNTVFITCVSYERRPILIEHADLVWKSIGAVQEKSGCELIAYAILPDHLHLVLDPRGGDFTTVMQRFKMSFGVYYRNRLALPAGRVWQHRYWDHVVRDQTDMNHHIDYIHFNPVKHGFVQDPSKWEHSSYREYLGNGMYEPGWGVMDVPAFEDYYGE